MWHDDKNAPIMIRWTCYGEQVRAWALDERINAKTPTVFIPTGEDEWAKETTQAVFIPIGLINPDFAPVVGATVQLRRAEVVVNCHAFANQTLRDALADTRRNLGARDTSHEQALREHDALPRFVRVALAWLFGKHYYSTQRKLALLDDALACWDGPFQAG